VGETGGGEQQLGNGRRLVADLPQSRPLVGRSSINRDGIYQAPAQATDQPTRANP
jgi:hypothetical protein